MNAGMCAGITVLLLSIGTPQMLAGKAPERIAFSSGSLELVGWLWKPDGAGPFPAILDNHGSEKAPVGEAGAPSADGDPIPDYFVSRGYVYFFPERRGHGNSQSAGPYIMDVVRQERAKNGRESGDALMVRLLETDHISDVMAGVRYLAGRNDVQKNRIAVIGSSFGGALALLAAEHDGVAAVVDFAGGAMNWIPNPAFRTRMLTAAGRARVPVLFIQAENDFDLGPSRELWAEMTRLGKPCKMHIYPAEGQSKLDGHRFMSKRVDLWGEEVHRFITAAFSPSNAIP